MVADFRSLFCNVVYMSRVDAGFFENRFIITDLPAENQLIFKQQVFFIIIERRQAGYGMEVELLHQIFDSLAFWIVPA